MRTTHGAVHSVNVDDTRVVAGRCKRRLARSPEVIQSSNISGLRGQKKLAEGYDLSSCGEGPGDETILIGRHPNYVIVCWFHLPWFSVLAGLFPPSTPTPSALIPCWVTTPPSIFSCWSDRATSRSTRVLAGAPTVPQPAPHPIPT